MLQVTQIDYFAKSSVFPFNITYIEVRENSFP